MLTDATVALIAALMRMLASGEYCVNFVTLDFTNNVRAQAYCVDNTPDGRPIFSVSVWYTKASPSDAVGLNRIIGADETARKIALWVYNRRQESEVFLSDTTIVHRLAKQI